MARPQYRQISPQAAAAQATSLAPVRPPRMPAPRPLLTRPRPPAAAHRVGLGAASAPGVQSSGGASAAHPVVVPARGGTWLQAARLQAAKMTVRLMFVMHSQLAAAAPFGVQSTTNKLATRAA